MEEPNVFDEGTPSGDIDFTGQQVPVSAPDRVVSDLRDRAAKIALLSKSANPVEDYQALMSGVEQGIDPNQSDSAVRVRQAATDVNYSDLLHMLSDPKVSPQEKTDAIHTFYSRPTMTLNEQLATDTVVEENPDDTSEEMRIRAKSAEGLYDSLSARQEISDMATQAIVKLWEGKTSTEIGTQATAELFRSGLVPMSFSKFMYDVGQETGEAGKWYSFFLPGSAKGDIQDKMLDVSPREAAVMYKNLLANLKNVDGIHFKGDNLYELQSFIDAVASGEQSTTVDRFLENMEPIALGLGGLFKAAKYGSKIRLIRNSATMANEAAAEVLRNKQLNDAAQAAANAKRKAELLLAQKAKAPDTSLLSTVKAVDKTDEYQKAVDNLKKLEGERARLQDGTGPQVKQAQESLAAMKPPVKDTLKDTTAEVLATSSDKITKKAAQERARELVASRYGEAVLDFEATQKRLQDFIKANPDGLTDVKRMEYLDQSIQNARKLIDAFPTRKGILQDSIDAIQWNQTVRIDNPSSPGNILIQTNPNKARKLFNAAMSAPTDAASLALYGASKVDTAVAQLAPQIITESGDVLSRIGRMSDRVSEEIKTLANDAGAEWATTEELERATANVGNKFLSALEDTNIVVNDAMGGIRVNRDGDVVSIDSVLSRPSTGWLDANEAVKDALHALRNFDVRLEDVEVLAQQGGKHVPVNLKDVDATPGNYMVRIRTPYKIGFNDITNPEVIESSPLAFFDSFSATLSLSKGNLSRHLFDAASLLPKIITAPGVRATDLGGTLTKSLLHEIERFTDIVDQLPKERQIKLNSYLEEMNLAAKHDDPVRLAAEFSDLEIQAIKEFRSFQDTMFFLENKVAITRARGEGWQMLDGGDTQLMAKPVNPSLRYQVASDVFDAKDGTFKAMSKDQVEKLYESGGYIAALRRPTPVNGKDIEHVIVRNDSSEYLRTIHDDDVLLNKRPGYYQVHYDAPKFVDIQKLDSKGNAIPGRVRTVAVAEDTAGAESWLRNTGSVKYTLGRDEKFVIRNSRESMVTGSDEWFDTQFASGRMAGRVRGAPLENLGPMDHAGSSNMLVNPVDSAVRAARSVGHHVPMSQVLTNLRQRWLSQFGSLTMKRDLSGLPVFPSSYDEIGGVGLRGTELRHARAVFAHIKYLESGYHNDLDDIIKSALGFGADVAAGMGASKLERGLNKAAQTSFASGAKSQVYKAVIAAHPLRQFFVNMNQSVRALAYGGPSFMVRAPKLMAQLMKEVALGKGEIIDFIKDSRLLENVDQHNLMRDVVENYLDHSQKALRTMGAPIRLLEQGFIRGEQASSIAHALAVWDQFQNVRKLNLKDAKVRGEAYSELRAILGDMNRAGDMPYNQNFLAIPAQFLQVPHKMLLQMFNKRIPARARFRLVMGDLAFWGLPAAAIHNSITEEMFPDPEIRQQMVHGLMDLSMNSAMNLIFGDINNKYYIDFSSLQAGGIDGIAKMLNAIWSEGGMEEIFAESPTGRLLGENGRVHNVLTALTRYFTPFIDKDMPETQFRHVLEEVARLSSGWNDMEKAKMIYELGQRRDASGRLLENNVPDWAAFFQLFGLGSRDVRWMYEVSKQTSELTKQKKEQIQKDVKEVLGVYTRMSGTGMDDAKFSTAVTGVLLSRYNNDPEARRFIYTQLRSMNVPMDTALMKKIIRGSGFIDAEERERLLTKSPVAEDVKKVIRPQLEALKALEKENENE